MNSWDWVEELIDQKRKIEMELPEDALLLMLKKKPLLQELINRLDLLIEF